MSTYIDGIGASQNIDTAGEVIDIMGMDITSLAVSGVFNFEHESKLPDQIVGKVLKAKKIFSEKDCEDERQMYYWSKCQIAFVYVMGELFDDYKDSAKEVAGMFRYDQDRKEQNEKNVMNFSIEGAKLEKQGNHIVKSIARKVTITVLPANHMAIAEMVPANKNKKDDIDSLFKTETNVEIELIKSEDMGELLKKLNKSSSNIPSSKPLESKGSLIGTTKSGKEVHSHERIHNYKNFNMQDHKDASALHHESMLVSKDSKTAQNHMGKKMLHHQAAGSAERRESRMDNAKSTVKSGGAGPEKIKTSVIRPYIKVDNLPAPVKKAMTAGSGMGSPGSLTGGAALAKQCIDPKMHKGCEHEMPTLAKARVDEGKTVDQKKAARPFRASGKGSGGVHTHYNMGDKNTPGHSLAGGLVREHKQGINATGISDAKGEHQHKLSQLKAMPKPNLSKSEEIFALAKEQYDNWNKKEQFVEFMSARMPKLTKSEIDVLGATMLLKKNMESENALESLVKSEGRCWTGYKPAKGKKPYSEGSCVKKTEDSLSKSEENSIGKTSSGKPIMSNHDHPSHASFTAQDHKDASAAHRDKASAIYQAHGTTKAPPTTPEYSHHKDQQTKHKASSEIKPSKTKDSGTAAHERLASNADAFNSAMKKTEDGTPAKLPAKFHGYKAAVKGTIDTEVEHVQPHYDGKSADTLYLKSGHKLEGHAKGVFKAGDKVNLKQHIMGTHLLEKK